MKTDIIRQRRSYALVLRIILGSIILGLASAAYGQQSSGKLIREVVHGRSLANSVTKESPDRNVSIYLPPSYETSSTRLYPVIYLLHGITDTDQTWTRAWSKNSDGYATILDVMDKGIADGRFGEMIIVMPDQNTRAMGSFYVNSSVTGNWEDFTAKELVGHIDSKYRTVAKPESRGITGHSMGGYGALTLAMKNPDVFSVAYGINPAIIGWGADLTIDTPGFVNVLKANTIDDLIRTRDLYALAAVTVSQAFSPNPNKPPFFADFPFAVVEGKVVPSEPGHSKWEANFPVRMVSKYKENLKKLRGLRFDSGFEDEFKFIPANSRAFSAELTKHGIEHIFEEYNGDHRNRMWSRTGRLHTEILPYFWLMLDRTN